MIPAATGNSPTLKPTQAVASQTGLRSNASQAMEAARSSIGESTATKAVETQNAITAPVQSGAVARLRDQETTERTGRTPSTKDAPTGPPPSFEESPLERQARVAFDPPDTDMTDDVQQPETDATKPDETTGEKKALSLGSDDLTERAEAGFAETKQLAEPPKSANLDVSR